MNEYIFSEEMLTEGVWKKFKSWLLIKSVAFLSEKNLDKILQKAKAGIISSKMVDSRKNGFVNRIDNAKSKKEKKEIIREFLRIAPEEKLAEADAKIKEAAKKAKKPIKEDFNITEGLDDTVKGIYAAANAGAAGEAITTTAGEVAALQASYEAAGKAAGAASMSFLGMSAGTTLVVGLIIGLILGIVIPIIIKKISDNVY